MKLSIVIPIYNAEVYLKRCLDSMTTKQPAEVEIICVNDGSTDDSAAILQERASKDARLVVINQKNQGTLVARKKGTLAAHGDYVTFIDPDDWFADGAIDLITAKTKEYDSDIVMFSTKVENVDNAKKRSVRKYERKQNSFPESLNDNEEMIRRCFVDRKIEWNIWGKAYKRELIQKAFSELPDIRCIFAEDRYCIFYIFTYAKTFRGVHQTAWNYSYGVGLSSRKMISINDYQRVVDSMAMCRYILDFAHKHFEENSVAMKSLNVMVKELTWEVINNMYIRVDGLKSFNDVAGLLTENKDAEYKTWLYSVVIDYLEEARATYIKKNAKHLRLCRWLGIAVGVLLIMICILLVIK